MMSVAPDFFDTPFSIEGYGSEEGLRVLIQTTADNLSGVTRAQDPGRPPATYHHPDGTEQSIEVADGAPSRCPHDEMDAVDGLLEEAGRRWVAANTKKGSLEERLRAVQETDRLTKVALKIATGRGTPPAPPQDAAAESATASAYIQVRTGYAGNVLSRSTLAGLVERIKQKVADDPLIVVVPALTFIGLRTGTQPEIQQVLNTARTVGAARALGAWPSATQVQPAPRKEDLL